MIREGSPQAQGKMPAWKGKLSEQTNRSVVAYIKSLWSAGLPVVVKNGAAIAWNPDRATVSVSAVAGKYRH